MFNFDRRQPKDKGDARSSTVVWLLFLFFVLSYAMSSCVMPKQAPRQGALNYKNPVFAEDFPDPFILRVGDDYYGYATNAGPMNIQIIHSTDLIHWTRAGKNGDALPQLPQWAAAGQFLTWAPSVLQQGDTFILYYVARYTAGGRQCISYAVSDKPDGPFVDASAQPLICQLDQGGSIDPNVFTDQDGTLYLLWKSDGNCCNLPVWLYSQPLSKDGRTLVGAPHQLITRDQAWEAPLVENPGMVLHNGKYYLIYSANWWESANYGIGYAVCETPSGPCRKPQDKPMVTSIGDTVGPGGASFFTDKANQLWMAYHAWTKPNVGYGANGQRRLYLGVVSFADQKPLIARPEAEQK
jgi:beta-xylosidase